MSGKTAFKRISELGGRTLTAIGTALLAALLIFASPEIGLAGAVTGLVAGMVSAVLMFPHHHP